MSDILPSQLCTFADFAVHLPVPIARRHYLRLSEIGRAPKYTRPAGRKSEPLFRREEVVDWFRRTYGDLLPERVAEFAKVFTNSAKSAPRARSRRERR